MTGLRLPVDTARRMELFGRASKDPHASGDADPWTTFYQPFLPLIEQDAAAFVDALARVCRPVGGWAVVGGGAYVLDAVPGQADHPQALAMLDDGIAFQRHAGVPEHRLTGFERERLRTRPPFPTTGAGPTGCPSCGRPRSPGAGFCTACGAPLGGAARPLPVPPRTGTWAATPVSVAAPASSSPWFTRPATAVVAALVALLAVGGATAAVVHARSGGTTSAPVAVAAPATAAVAATDPGGATTAATTPTDPTAQLQAQAASDSAGVEGMVGSWVPQLSSKRPGLVADGQTYDAASILAEHEALRSTHTDARLLWTGDFANYRGRNFWATVVGEPMPTAAAANAWCDTAGLDADHCYAVRLTHTGGPEGNAVMRPHR